MKRIHVVFLVGLTVLLLATGCGQQLLMDQAESTVRVREGDSTSALIKAVVHPEGSTWTTTDLEEMTPVELVANLVGSGGLAPIISNVTYTGAHIAAGTFSDTEGTVGFNNGIILSSGNIANVIGPNQSDGITVNNGLPGDSDLDGLIQNYVTYDATVLEFDFECPSVDVVSFQYVFMSDEYNEYVNTQYNDVFGFFLNGVNIALIPTTPTPVSINNVNGGNPLGTNPSNPVYYINNDLSDGGPFHDTEMDGFTTVFYATGNLMPGVNHIKLAIADAGDRILDSNVLIKGESFVGAPPFFEVEVAIDIKPGSDPNSINFNNANEVIPVAILTTEDFDALTVNHTTVTFEGATEMHEDRKTYEPRVHKDDVDGDGDTDLVFHFRLAETALALDSTVGTLVGETLDGTPITGTDSVRMID